MIIECEVCDTRPGVDHDCMVAFLTDPARHERAVHMDADQAAAVEYMVKGGLIPPLHVVPPLTPNARPQGQRSATVASIRRVS